MTEITYTEAVKKLVSNALKKYFNDEVNGGKGDYGDLDHSIKLLSFLYDKDEENVHYHITNLLSERIKDLRKDWEQAIKGNFTF
jgi:hypothetical protein